VVSIGRPAADESPADAEYAESPPSPGPASLSVAPPGPSRKPAPTGTLAATRNRKSKRPLWRKRQGRAWVLAEQAAGEAVEIGGGRRDW
jgi:hypothetical protein